MHLRFLVFSFRFDCLFGVFAILLLVVVAAVIGRHRNGMQHRRLVASNVIGQPRKKQTEHSSKTIDDESSRRERRKIGKCIPWGKLPIFVSLIEKDGSAFTNARTRESDESGREMITLGCICLFVCYICYYENRRIYLRTHVSVKPYIFIAVHTPFSLLDYEFLLGIILNSVFYTQRTQINYWILS